MRGFLFAEKVFDTQMKTRKASTLTISLAPFNPLLDLLDAARQVNFDVSEIKLKLSGMTAGLVMTLKSRNGQNKIKRLIPLAIILVAVLVVLVGVKTVVQKAFGKVSGASDVRVQVAGPIASRPINKQLEIPIKDDKGKEVTKIKYDLQSAELRDEIIVQGQRMVSVKGRVFLILSIKLTNDYNQAINVNARDDVRLVVPGSDDKIAADIHNDPVAVQPASTKITRLGFPIDDSKKHLVLQLGLLDGQKQTIDLNF